MLSDPHGRYDKYRAMLEEIQFKSTDILYVLGDVIDRGPDGVDILRDMMGRPNVVSLLGNHEFTAAMCLPWLLSEVTEQNLDSLNAGQFAALQEWLANGGGPTLRALGRLIQEEREVILEDIQTMDVYIETEVRGRSFLLVHAGLGNFSPDKPLEDYTLADLLFGRPAPDAAYYPDRTVVFGHTPARFFGGQDRIFRGEGFIAVDCGCAFGGPLGCLRLETMEEFYV